MSKGIRQHYLDFEILETLNPRTIVFVDSSEYFEQPEKPLLDVTLPGYAKYFVIPIESGHVNVFNSNTLGLTKVLDTECLIELPDGVYTLKYRICPYKLLNRTKYFLRTTRLAIKLNQIYSTLEFGDCSLREQDSLKNELIEITLLIESAKASTELSNIEVAAEKYKMANEKVDKILENLKNN